jgi:Flp pilus assembly protein TadD
LLDGLTDGWRHLATDAMQRGGWSQAIWHLDRRIASAPEDWLTYCLRTKANLQLGRLDWATADYTHAVALGPSAETSNWYRLQLAETEESKQWPQALWYLDRLCTREPRDWRLFDSRACVYLALGKADKAEADCARARALDPDTSFFVYWANNAAIAGRWDKVIADFAKALELDETDARVEFALALAQLRQADLVGYRRVCAHLLARYAANKEHGMLIHDVWICALHPDALADWSNAVRVAEDVLAQHAKDPDLQNENLTLGVMLFRAERYPEAIEHLQRADNLPASLFLAMAEHRLGKTQAARDRLRGLEPFLTRIRNMSDAAVNCVPGLNPDAILQRIC